MSKKAKQKIGEKMKGWKKIGKVVRPQKSLVIVDGQGNVLARKIGKKLKRGDKK